MRDGELDPSTLRRPQALRTDAPRNRITAEPRNRVLLPVALCLTLLAAPLLLVKAATGRAHSRPTVRTVADRTVALNSPVAEGYGVPDGILTAADLAAASADGATASGASAAAPAAGAGSGVQAHIASVGPASPVTAPESSVSTTSPPTTSAPPTTRPRSTTTTAAPTTTTTRAPASSPSSSSNSERGSASWYDAPAGTCAHPTLAFGTVVTVENLANGATTTCRVEDRGPYQGGRIIDLSEQSFSQIAPTSDGVIQVRISW